MRIGAFEVDEPLPELREPQVASMLSPWLNAGNVGSLALAVLERHLDAKTFARLARPGTFFDFTRYRPTIHFDGEKRVFTVPNCNLSFVRRQEAPDLVFLHLLEPHAFAEDYTESLLELLKVIKAKRFYRMGAMWDSVPHTRPLPLNRFTGSSPARGGGGARPPQGRYEGPTSILSLLTEGMEKIGVETASVMVRLPYYAQLEEDHTGVARVLEHLCDLWQIPTTFIDWERGRRQYRWVSSRVQSDPEATSLVKELEEAYDTEGEPTADPPRLSPEIEQLLREMNERFRASDQ